MKLFKRKPKPPKHQHTWLYVSAQVSYYPWGGGYSTHYSRICVSCQKRDSGEMKGHWSLDILNLGV